MKKVNTENSAFYSPPSLMPAYARWYSLGVLNEKCIALAVSNASYLAFLDSIS